MNHRVFQPLDTGSALVPVDRWHIHLGAHKTATTHLQETLAAIRPVLLEKGIDYIPLDAMRPVTNRLLRRSARIKQVFGRLSPELGRVIDGLRQGPDHVILSEENLLGRLEDCFALPPYGGLGWRLAALAGMLGETETRVFLTIRRMDEFLPSAYAQALRHNPQKQRFTEIRARLLTRPPRWTEIVARIESALPRARVEIWLYEDYRAHAAEFVQRLTGVDPGSLPEIEVPRSTATPSAAAIASMEALDRRRLAGPRWTQMAQAICARDPASAKTDPFRPFSAEDSARFAALYDEDCAALAARGLLHRFGV
jgi:hypothetical protein